MFGIAGSLRLDGKRIEDHWLYSMAAQMIHRGPDSEGIWCDQYVGLVLRRLSIIDLEAGKQSISNEDGSVWVVLNGEIYNLRELRRELESQGHVFKTASDTEVLVHGYKQWGKEFLVRRWE
jgi:asparagine synthase (glutamine-hydrolysing)